MKVAKDCNMIPTLGDSLQCVGAGEVHLRHWSPQAFLHQGRTKSLS